MPVVEDIFATSRRRQCRLLIKLLLVYMSHSSRAASDKSDSEDEELCRICQDAGSEPILTPCSCKGTMGMMHLTCLATWLAHSSRRSCELCGEQYSTSSTLQQRNVVLSALFWVSHQDETVDQDERTLGSDSVIFVVTTPIIVLSVFCCVWVADYYSQDYFFFIPAGWTAFAVLILMMILIALYFYWLSATIRYHSRRWFNWWQRDAILTVVYNGKSGTSLPT